MNRSRIHPEALREIEEQARYYEERSPGLGHRFVDQIEQAIELAVAMPGIGTRFAFGTRRVFPRDFPFSVVYKQNGDSVVVIAVAAFRRKPGYWKQRRRER